MPYKINKTNGSLLANVQDGKINNDYSGINLIGKNYIGFGELVNENFIKLLENFAYHYPPVNPIQGQLWYDTSSMTLNVFTGQVFTPLNSISLSLYTNLNTAADIENQTQERLEFLYPSDNYPEGKHAKVVISTDFNTYYHHYEIYNNSWKKIN